MKDWFIETLYPTYGQAFKQENVLFEVKTEHQELVIFKNEHFGNVMALDGIIQTTEKDEFVYHEMMVHVPLFTHGNAKSVLIIGGGDGGILREVCKHKGVEKITQVEIDAKVIEMCKQYFPGHSNGAFDDPRVNIVINDGMKFVAECQEKYDVIISDSTDPIGPGEVLFTKDFYSYCHNILNPGGIFVAQNGVAYMQLEEVSTSYKRLGASFKSRTFYSAAVPTYIGGIMTFAWASDNDDYLQLDQNILQRRYAEADIATKYYNPAVHVGSFALPNYILEALK